MKELERISTGGREACVTHGEEVALCHACKTCHSKLCGQPASDAADYLAAEDSGELYLNMIDPDKPLFRVEMFRRFLDWAEDAWRAGKSVVIHCDRGESRSRTLALLLGVRLGLLPDGYLRAASRLSAVSGRSYRPGVGLRAFVSEHWAEIMAPVVVKERAESTPRVRLEARATERVSANGAGIHPKSSSDAWKASGARGVIDERKANEGYSLAELDEIADNPEKWARLFGRIPERVSKEPIRFVPSPLQRRMFYWYRLCQSVESPCRMVVPKIRRGGGSTGAQAIMYCHAHNYGARLGSIGTDDEVAMNMFKMIRFFDKWDKFPGWGKAVKILETGLMEWGNGSSWEKYTAERPEAARSAGLQGYHASEVGRWQDGGAKDARETLKSMLGAVPRRGFTVVIEESTAQGAVGAFYDRFTSGRWPTAEELCVPEGREYWRKWAEETPQNIAGSDAERRLQFVRVFAAWFEDDENRPELGVGAEEGAKIMATLDAKEIELIRRYRTIGPQGERLGDMVKKATMVEQLAWRRSVIATEFEGDVEGFQQENPSSPQEAFASSGRHTFNRAGCAWMSETAKGRTPEIGVIERQPDGGVVFRRTTKADAWVQVWDLPREAMRYIQAVDTMGGRSHTKNLDTADFNAALLLRAAYVDSTAGVKMPHRVVASLLPGNQDDPDVLAMKCDLLSDFYGGCLCVHEDNNTGAAFRQEARRLGMNLYLRIETDKHTFEQTEYVGWSTTPETRPQLFATGKKYVRNNAKVETRPDGFECWDEAACKEFTDCILHPDGKDAAPGSKHDDRVMAAMIGLHTIEGATYYAGKRRKRRDPGDRNLWRPGR